MPVYLLRHAHAIDLVDDSARPLSPRGREQVHALAAFLRRSNAFAPAEVWHSALLRSRETAELLLQRLGLTVPLTLMPDLQPEDDPRAVARRIKAIGHSLLVVGHEPHLSALATLLVTGRAQPAAFLMKKCALLALDGIESHWSVRWHVSPEVLPKT